uniref:Major facilitator superfamily (MFS) profile domain-containing protein n=1 Tax=Panagrolaimus sp. ES5 TaxID=591445 RepID=A0AC34GPU3_9BILA
MAERYHEVRGRGRTMTTARTRARTSSINVVSENYGATDPFGIIFEDDEILERRYTNATAVRSRLNTISSIYTIKEKELKGEILDDEPKTNWASIYTLTLVTIFNGMQFSVFFASLWPFLNTVDPTATATFFGLITSGYCLAQTITGPIFGLWMNKSGSVKPPLATGIIIMALGNVLYAFIEEFSETNRRWAMLVARCAVGAGSGCLGVMRAYGATASTLKDRARAITFVSAAFVIGLTVGPGLQVAFTPFGYPGKLKIGPIRIDEYTSPAIFAVLVDAASVCVLIFFFSEHYAGLMVKQEKEDPYFVLPSFKRLPTGICIFTQFCMMFVITNTEAIGSMYSIAMFDWTNSDAVFYTGIIQTVGGVVSLFTYLAFAFRIGRYVSQSRERMAVIIAICLALIYHVITFPFPFLPNDVDQKTILNDQGKNETVGCLDSYDWCGYTKKVPFWLYAITNVICMSLAFPVLNISMSTLFSKILGNRKQGTMQSVSLMAGSFARTIGPLLMTTIFEKYGPMLIWGIEIIVLAICVTFWIIFYYRIVPLDCNPELQPGEYYKYKKGYKYRF